MHRWRGPQVCRLPSRAPEHRPVTGADGTSSSAANNYTSHAAEEAAAGFNVVSIVLSRIVDTSVKIADAEHQLLVHATLIRLGQLGEDKIGFEAQIFVKSPHAVQHADRGGRQGRYGEISLTLSISGGAKRRPLHAVVRWFAPELRIDTALG